VPVNVCVLNYEVHIELLSAPVNVCVLSYEVHIEL
jgi:hypothetical protein